MTTMTTVTTAPADAPSIKARQQAMWASGNFAVIGTTLDVPPPPGARSPLLWGTKAHLRDLFADAASVVHTVRHFAFRYESPAHFVDVFRRFYGPVHKAFAALDADGQASLEADLIALLRSSDRGGAAGVVVPSEYLETVIIR
jgi:hypothetical protein